MPAAVFLKTTAEIADKYDASRIMIVITGGEPLLHRDLERIGQRIADHGMRWGMVSNGMVLSKERLEKLIAAGLDSITLSVDGLEDAHNLIRNHPKAFSKINQALAVVGDSSLVYKDAVTCVFPHNLNQLNDLADILLSHQIRSWRLFRIFPSGRATDNDLLLLSFEQTQQLLQWIVQNKKKYQEKGLTINLSCEGWLPMSLDEQVRDTPFFCRAGINIASILSDGTITGCSNNHSSFHVGNVLKDDLAYVWENKFDDFRQREWVDETTCSSCEHIRSCKGNSIHLWDKNNTKPNFCYVKDLS